MQGSNTINQSQIISLLPQALPQAWFASGHTAAEAAEASVLNRKSWQSVGSISEAIVSDSGK